MRHSASPGNLVFKGTLTFLKLSDIILNVIECKALGRPHGHFQYINIPSRVIQDHQAFIEHLLCAQLTRSSLPSRFTDVETEAHDCEKVILPVTSGVGMWVQCSDVKCGLSFWICWACLRSLSTLDLLEACPGVLHSRLGFLSSGWSLPWLQAPYPVLS